MSAERHLTDQDYELLSAYLDGQLPDSARSALESRLETEANLRRELAALRQTVALVKGLSTLKAPRDFILDASVIRPTPRQRLLIFPTTVAFSALSAAAAVLLLAASLVLLQSNLSLAPLSNTVSSQEEPGGDVAVVPTEVFQVEPTGELDTSQRAVLTPTVPLTATPSVPPSPVLANGAGLVVTEAATSDSAQAASEVSAYAAPSEAQAQIPSTESELASSQPEADETDEETVVEETAPLAFAPADTQATPFIADDTAVAALPTPTLPLPAPAGGAAESADAITNLDTIKLTATALSQVLGATGANPTLTATIETERATATGVPSPVPGTEATLSPTATPSESAGEDARRSGTDQNTLAGALLAAGVVLLVVAGATTLARRRR